MRAGLPGVAALLLAGVTACASPEGDSTAVTTPPTSAVTTSVTTTAAPSTTEPPATTAPAVCDGLASPVAVGTVDIPQLDEASGLVVGRRNPGIVWIINDSGDPVIYGVDETGALQATVRLTGAVVRDWEDLAVGPGPDPGPFLYVADIGDNLGRRESVTLWRLAEPSVAAGGPLEAEPDRLDVTYPDGPHDAETLLVDPLDATIYIIAKELSGDSAVFAVEWGTGPSATARPAGIIDLGLGGLATGGDVAADGALIAVRTYGDVRLWVRPAGTAVEDVLASPPCRGPVAPEPQGEAIGFVGNGPGYLTLSEGVAPPLYLVADRG